MLKKTITYTDYNGTEREETFYFNIKRSLAMKLAADDEFFGSLQSVYDGTKPEKIVYVLSRLIRESYGEKDPSGRRFVQSKELSDAFEQTEAYDQLFMSLCYDSEKAAAFINGVIPAGLLTEMQDAVKKAASEGKIKNADLLKEIEAATETLKED